MTLKAGSRQKWCDQKGNHLFSRPRASCSERGRQLTHPPTPGFAYWLETRLADRCCLSSCPSSFRRLPPRFQPLAVPSRPVCRASCCALLAVFGPALLCSVFGTCVPGRGRLREVERVCARAGAAAPFPAPSCVRLILNSISPRLPPSSLASAVKEL